MAIVDPVEQTIVAAVAILDADAELQALFGRATKLALDWDSWEAEPVTPVFAVLPLSTVDGEDFDSDRFSIQFSAFGPTRAVVNKAVHRAKQILTYPAFLAHGIEVARDARGGAQRKWPGAGAEIGDAVQARADLDLTFLIPATTA